MLWNSIKALRKENADLKEFLKAAEMKIDTQNERISELSEKNRAFEENVVEQKHENMGFFLNIDPFCSHCMRFEADVDKIDTTTLGRDGKTGIIEIRCERNHICRNLYRHLAEEVKNGKREQKV